MAKFKFNFGSDTSTTLFHNANASGNDFNMYTTCHAAGEAVFGNIRVSGTSQFGIICSDSCIHLIKSSGNAIIKSESGDNAGDLYLIGNRTSNNDTSNLTFYNSSEPIARIRAYRHGANDAGKLSFATQATGGNPVEHMTICPDGKVGIGTDSPDYLLDVEASSGYAYSRTVATANSQRALGIYQGKDGSGNVVDMRIGAIADATQGGIFTFTNHNLTFATNNASPQMTLTTGGNLSIGSTSSTYPLQAITNIADGTNPQIVARDLGTSDATVGFQIASAANWSIGIDNSDSDKFKIATGLDVGSNNIMTMLSGGNVGIGDTSPENLLSLRGASPILSVNATGSTDPKIRLMDGDTMRWDIYSDESDSDKLFISDDDQTRRMVIQQDGNVGIGTTSPDTLLESDVDSASTGTDSITARNKGVTTVGHTVGFKYQFNSAVPAASRAILTNASSGVGRLGFFVSTDATAGNLTEYLSIKSDGNVGIGTTTPDTLLKVHQTGTSGNSYFEGSVQIGGANASYGAILGYSALNSGRVNISNLNNAGGADATIKLGFGAITTGEPANPVMTVNQSGNVGIGNTSPEARLDIQDGNIALVVGADNGATSMTDATTKTARMGVHHYTNDEEPLAILVADSQSTTGTLSIGGGTSTLNATSFIKFYTAADGTTTTGTERMSINNSGVVCSACCFLSPVVCGSSCVSSPKVFATDFCFHTGDNGTFGKAQTNNASTSSLGVIQLGTNNVVDPHRDGDGSAGSGSILFHMLQAGLYNNNKAGAQQATQVGYWNNICDTDTDNNETHSLLLQIGHTNTIKNNYYLAGTGTCGKYTKYGAAIGNCNSIDKTGYYCAGGSCYYYGSVAMGNCNCVQCEGGVAVGSKNIVATGGNSSAIGYNNCACAQNASAIGFSSVATGHYSTAIGYDASVSAEGHMALGVYNSGDWVCTNGGICAAGDMVACTSDRRLKCNILTITCAIERLKNIRGVSFEWDRDYIKKEGIKFSPREKSTTYGFIAQELEESVPDAVLEAPFAEAINKKLTDKEKYKTIKPEKIIPFLVEASKEQQLTIEKQQQQINTLTCQVEMLLKRCA